MNPGELNEKITILTLSLTENMYQWSAAASVWTKAEQLKDSNLFLKRRWSEVKSVKFTMRKYSISFSNAILWNNQYYYLTDIVEIDRMYDEVTAMLVELKTCTVTKTGVSLDSMNRPVTSEISKLTFPGCLTETYSKKGQKKPMSFIEMRYLLTVPKAIELEAGELITIGDTAYEVWVPHFRSDYKNEYEIRVRRDA